MLGNIAKSEEFISAQDKQHCFAKEMNSSFWDSMTEEEISDRKLETLNKLLEFIENDY